MDLQTGAKNKIYWTASTEALHASHLWAFKLAAEKKFSLKFSSYEELHRWSCDHFEDFWAFFLAWSGIVQKASETFLQACFSLTREKPFLPSQRGTFYGGTWFKGLQLNYAENLLKNLADMPLRAFYEENILLREFTRAQLLGAVKYFQDEFLRVGLKKGDVVAAFVGSNHLAVIAMLAATSIGAAWSSASPDFGEQAVLDRFGQVKPKILLTSSRTRYNGKKIDLAEKTKKIAAAVCGSGATQTSTITHEPTIHLCLETIEEKMGSPESKLEDIKFTPMDFSDPLYIMFSSGTTGEPKCLVHSVGGTLLQHAKEHLLHGNLQAGERFTYYTTTGWMMWNWMVSALFCGVELYTLEGAPLIERKDSAGKTTDKPWTMWDFVRGQKISAFGTSAKFISTCMSKGLQPSLKNPPRITFSTGSPLLPEDFDYYYSAIDPAHKSQLASICGGTDIVSCFMLGNVLKPLRRGEIQAAGLGMAIDAYSEDGKSVRDVEGELVCTKPFPSMPTHFLNDPDFKKYEEAYFGRFSGSQKNIWFHGDYIVYTRDGGIIVLGRSDSTLNPGGVRIGTADIYRALTEDLRIEDSIVVGKTIGGDEKIVLFLKLKAGNKFNDEIITQVKKSIREKLSPRHVPHFIFQVNEIPYTLSGKKVEIAVKKILRGEAPKNIEALQNPQVLREYEAFRATLEKG